MQASFRVDASIDIGFGHVMRCLALADGLTERGVHCTFICRDMPGHLGKIIQARGFELKLLPLSDYIAPERPDDYAAWLQVSEITDAEQVIGVLPIPCDYLVVDHYGLGIDWELMLRSKTKCLVAIDDLNREHAVEYLIDQTRAKSVVDYPCIESNNGACQPLIGSEYALMSPAFYQRRELLVDANWQRQYSGDQHRLLISMGGVDQPNVTATALNVIVKQPPNWLKAIDIVLPETAPHVDAVAKIVAEHSSVIDVKLHSRVDDMTTLLASCTMAIGAPGVSTWERAALGIPAVLVVLAANQQAIASSMARDETALLVNKEDIDIAILPALAKLQSTYSSFVARSAGVTDGLGARRVAQRLTAEAGPNVYVQVARASHLNEIFALCSSVTDGQVEKQAIEHILLARDSYVYLLKDQRSLKGFIQLKHCDKHEYELKLLVQECSDAATIGFAAIKLVAELHREIALRIDFADTGNVNTNVFASVGFASHGSGKYLLAPRVI